MAAYKETPRQKMIAMMYLVLTALLALNVSVEILEAFIVVNESLETTNDNLNRKVTGSYGKFEQQFILNPKKVGPYWEQAKKAHKLATDMINYIQTIKYDVISKVEGIPVDSAKVIPLRLLHNKDNYDKPTNYFIGDSQDGSAGKSKELKLKLQEFNNNMVQYIDPKARGTIKGSINLDGPYHDASGARQNWEMHHFYYTILAADVTILNKLISDVYGYEFDVINHLYASVDAQDFKFNRIEAKVIPKSNYVFLGDKYEADVFVAAYDTLQNPEVIVNGRPILGKAGKAHFEMAATREGFQNITGFIRAKDATGAIISYPFKQEFLVAPPSYTISPTKMNVFYIGVENPVSISAGGIPDVQLRPSITPPASIYRAAGGRGWEVKVPGSLKTAKISISALVDGKIKNIGSLDFRVKRVPSPIAKIGNSDGGPIAKNVLLASGAIIPIMPEDFEFDLNFTIVSFSFAVVRGGDYFNRDGRGNVFTDEMKNLIRTAKRGERVWVDNIIARGPDGANRKLNSINLIVQ
jgi:gliding motility-associated protein GldM